MDETKAPDDESKREGVTPKAAERLDAEGLPLDRELTLDDVRGEGSGRTIAVGCTVLVLLAVLGFWVLRAAMLH